jgi:hypothetical protein
MPFTSAYSLLGRARILMISGARRVRVALREFLWPCVLLVRGGAIPLRPEALPHVSLREGTGALLVLHQGGGVRVWWSGAPDPGNLSGALDVVVARVGGQGGRELALDGFLTVQGGAPLRLLREYVHWEGVPMWCRWWSGRGGSPCPGDRGPALADLELGLVDLNGQILFVDSREAVSLPLS